MKLWNWKRQKNKEKKYYIYQSADDCPAYNYYKASKDLRFLYKDWIDDVVPELQSAYENIADELSKVFGVSPKIQNLMLKEKQLVLKQTELLLTDKKRLITDIEMIVKQLESMKKSFENEKEFDPEQLAADLQVRFNQNIDLKTISILRFYYLIKRAQDNG